MVSDLEEARIQLELITKIHSEINELLNRGVCVTVSDVMDDLDCTKCELESEVEELESD